MLRMFEESFYHPRLNSRSITMSEFPEIQPFGPRPAPHNEDPSNEARANHPPAEPVVRSATDTQQSRAKPYDSRCNGRRSRICSRLPDVPISAADSSPKQARRIPQLRTGMGPRTRAKNHRAYQARHRVDRVLCGAGFQESRRQPPIGLSQPVPSSQATKILGTPDLLGAGRAPKLNCCDAGL